MQCCTLLNEEKVPLKLSAGQKQRILERYQIQIVPKDKQVNRLENRLSLRLDINRQNQCVQVQLALYTNKQPLISVELVDSITGLHGYQVNNMAGDLNIVQEQWRGVVRVVKAMYRCFIESDAELIDVYSLEWVDGAYAVWGIEIDIDERASYRQSQLVDEPVESLPALQYIELGGQVGCIANGAGLCMAMIDAIYHFGAEAKLAPSCFVEIEDDRLLEILERALELVSFNPKTSVVMVYLFSMWYPITSIAEHFIAGLQGIEKPVIVILEGQDESMAQDIIHNARLRNVSVAHTLTEAVGLAVRKVSV